MAPAHSPAIREAFNRPAFGDGWAIGIALGSVTLIILMFTSMWAAGRLGRRKRIQRSSKKLSKMMDPKGKSALSKREDADDAMIGESDVVSLVELGQHHAGAYNGEAVEKARSDEMPVWNPRPEVKS